MSDPRATALRAWSQSSPPEAEIDTQPANAAIAPSGDDPHNPDMFGERLAKLEGLFEGLKSSLDSMRFVLSILVAVLLGGFAFLGTQMVRLDTKSQAQIEGVSAKVDGISSKISDEFRAMRAEQSAQTSAIANSITAAKQQQPQVILMPAPQQERAPKTNH